MNLTIMARLLGLAFRNKPSWDTGAACPRAADGPGGQGCSSTLQGKNINLQRTVAMQPQSLTEVWD